MSTITIWCVIGVACSMLTAYYKPKYYFATLFTHSIGWLTLIIMIREMWIVNTYREIEDMKKDGCQNNNLHYSSHT